MPISHVRSLIESNPDWLSVLETTYKIDVVRDGDLVSLKYNMIESPMNEPIVQECRGMVVDTVTNQIVAHPYNKFWNVGEQAAAAIDWSTARVQEKLDGSLMIVYLYKTGWRVASSGNPTAGGSFGKSTETFRDAFWRIFNSLGMYMPFVERENTCYMFELCAAENRIVVRHEQPRIVLHGARGLDHGCERSRGWLESQAERHCWEIVKEYPLQSIAACVDAVNQLDPIQNEGFVVVDGSFNRVKIKSPKYVMLHHMKGEATTRRAIELWQTGEGSELLATFPEMSDVILPVHAKLDSIAQTALETFQMNRHLPTRKDFAMAVKNVPWAGIVFQLYGESAPTIETAKTIMRGNRMAALERLVEEN